MDLGSDLRNQCPSRRAGVFNVDMISERGVHGDAVLEQFDHLDDEFGLAVLQPVPLYSSRGTVR